MTTHDAFLAAVIANPADDLPRLVFADWLEENGQPERAEYIRCEIQRARLDREVLCHQPVAQMGDWCTDTLCPKCGQQFRRSYLPCPPEDMFCTDDMRAVLDRLESVVWERGFISQVHCTLADWCGGRCPETDVPPGMENCPRCGGTGRLPPGVGPAVVCSHPVERVVVTDREPLPRHLSGGYRPPTWTQYGSHANTLPGWLLEWVRLTDMHDVAETPGGPGSDLSYEDADTANAALSTAMIAWAKSQPHPAALHLTPVSADVTG